MQYTYILKSITDPTKTYIGCTSDLKTRLKSHNSGSSSHTAKYRPWKIEVYLAFSSNKKALAFEKYLKSGSGRAFAKKHFYSLINIEL
jgi:putative endonuclease